MTADQIANGTRCSIRVDGRITPLTDRVTMDICEAVIRPRSCTDVVQLKHLGSPMMVMVVDDTGMVDHRPVNPIATALYHANCVPGTVFPICGDVVIAPDEDFAR